MVDTVEAAILWIDGLCRVFGDIHFHRSSGQPYPTLKPELQASIFRRHADSFLKRDVRETEIIEMRKKALD